MAFSAAYPVTSTNFGLTYSMRPSRSVMTIAAGLWVTAWDSLESWSSTSLTSLTSRVLKMMCDLPFSV